jgi:hypothetical protein
MAIYWHEGIFYMLTHTTQEVAEEHEGQEEPEEDLEEQDDEERELVPDFGRLSLWDGEGRLLVSHALQQGPSGPYRCCHPNSLAVFSA